ncbi:MAG: 16S rRNA (guanine(527)-N(7))-methyltransferase RsmG [Planctomycetota bacterium]|jgi:16S rRNA (guanine527-N7)-methyltransferase
MQPLAAPETFLTEAEAYGIAFDPGDLDRLGLYLALLLDANTRFNLTAVTDPDEAWMKHVFDSLTLLGPLTAAAAKWVIDVGSGGGLPGIPLAIALPHVKVTLLEATGKKARFLEEAAGTLGLDNVTVINERAEVAGQDRERHREHYDVAVARAVGSLAVLLELAMPLVKVGGWVMVIKGKKAKLELERAAQAIRLLHGQPGPITRTPTGAVVVVEKLRETAKRYPRRPGEPKRAPLGGVG